MVTRTIIMNNCTFIEKVKFSWLQYLFSVKRGTFPGFKILNVKRVFQSLMRIRHCHQNMPLGPYEDISWVYGIHLLLLVWFRLPIFWLKNCNFAVPAWRSARSYYLYWPPLWRSAWSSPWSASHIFEPFSRIILLGLSNRCVCKVWYLLMQGAWHIPTRQTAHS